MATILVIDDTQALLNALVELLQFAGYSVISASDGTRGLALANQHQPDLILCDLIMHPMNGIQFLNQIRQDDRLAGTPFLLMTATSELITEYSMAHAIPDGYLLKPFTAQSLHSAIQAALRKA